MWETEGSSCHLDQMDMWDKPKGLRKRSICCGRLAHTLICIHNVKWQQRRLLNSTQDSAQRKTNIYRQPGLFTSPSQCITAPCTAPLASSMPSLPPSLSNQQHQGCRGTKLHKTQIRVAIWTCGIKAVLYSYAVLFSFFPYLSNTRTLNKTLFLTHCKRITKLLVSLNYDPSIAMLMSRSDGWIHCCK